VLKQYSLFFKGGGIIRPEEKTRVKCDQCCSIIEQGEEREYRGQKLCEDCYMDFLSPLKTCDPWAVHSAKSLEKHTQTAPALTPIQSEIMRALEETGGIEPAVLLERLDGKLTLPQLEREFASLRHMEKARGERREGRVFLRPW
jgi:hypothetical protein